MGTDYKTPSWAFRLMIEASITEIRLHKKEGIKMETTFCDLFGIDLPIAQAAIGGAAVPALAAAVSNVGGLGTVNLTGYDAESARQMIQHTRELTSSPFCVNFLLPYEGHYEAALDVSLTEKIPGHQFILGRSCTICGPGP
jgi:NAD(P)H-dependent flavin oxidoreductase YrpB (nitropropane dioxygenase family)